MNFSTALDYLREGTRVCRSSWNSENMWIHIQVPDEHNKMTEPYIYIKTTDNKLVPWIASQMDILAEDWVVFE